MNNFISTSLPQWRHTVVLGLLLASALFLIWRVIDLHVIRKDFLQGQGDARHLRVVNIVAHRGMIMDRNGEPLAVSTPVDSVWADPGELATGKKQWPQLARLLGVKVNHLKKLLVKRGKSEFVYLKRHVNPDLAQKVKALGVPGVSLQREYRRYYPTGEVAGHVLGFTNIDDSGQEGIELAYDDWLKGTPGKKRVIKDRMGNIVEDVESIKAPSPGHDLVLSIDRRIQYLAYRELKAAVKKHKARSGSVVILNVQTGEVLAMVNQPSFNPNNRRNLKGGRYRNRAVTDVFEPGSAIKPFTIAAALSTGKFRPNTMIQTTPGTLKVGKNLIRDRKNFGSITVSTVIQKSSNVGASKIALAIPGRDLWDMFDRVGFGAVTNSGYPGESSGMLSDYRNWREIEQATLAFGYGLSVTPLQLARAYLVLATGGMRPSVTFLHVDPSRDVVNLGERVVSKSIASKVRKMLELVVEKGGTGQRAQVPGYHIAGKTGTARKAGVGGYQKHEYVAVFAGMAPASRPQLVMVVMINEPSNGEYYGGKVTAPVFARVMAGSLRLLNIPPDNLPSLSSKVARLGERP